MKLEQFREIADENLRELVVDERMLQCVHQKMYAEKAPRKQLIPRRAFALAVACIAVMLISGGVLAGTMGFGKEKPAKQMGVSMAYQHPVNSASKLSAHTKTSEYIDGTILSYGVKQVGEFHDGYAPALATNGLYGIVNEDHVWVVKALYDEVVIDEDGKAVVVQKGAEQFIEISAK